MSLYFVVLSFALFHVGAAFFAWKQGYRKSAACLLVWSVVGSVAVYFLMGAK